MPADLQLGPEGNQWYYDRSTRTFDLTRQSGSKRYTVKTVRGPAETSVCIDPEKTALVVVDMQVNKI
jgi:phosphatidylethanolamine-binding protein